MSTNLTGRVSLPYPVATLRPMTEVPQAPTEVPQQHKDLIRVIAQTHPGTAAADGTDQAASTSISSTGLVVGQSVHHGTRAVSTRVLSSRNDNDHGDSAGIYRPVEPTDYL